MKLILAIDYFYSFANRLDCLTFNFNTEYFLVCKFIQCFKEFFSYYIDPELELKFDMDDLFYYSSHAIMKRGNHFFVADYGLQENVASRYGKRKKDE